MATRVALAKIWMTPVDRPTPRTPSLVQNSGTYLECELSYCDFCVKISKFSLPCQQGLTQISLTQLNRQTSKTPYLAQESWYLTHKLSYSRLCDKIYQFCYHGNKGGSSENLNDSVWSANPRTPSLVQNSGIYLKCELSYGKFCVEISKFLFPWQQGLVWDKFRLRS